VYGTVSKATPARGMLPNLIIIGAPKAGTTSLHRYLDLHPDVAMTTEKELRYFWRADWRDRLPWYEAQFEFEGQPRVRGEATPAYAAYPHRDNVPRRMHELVPEVKLIYLVRDPIERLVSHWAQRRADGDLTPFAAYMQELDRPDNPIICASRYWLQLAQYLRFFRPDQLLVVDQHELRIRRDETLAEVFGFLGVDEGFRSPEFALERNIRADKSEPRRVTTQLWDTILWPASRLVPRRVRDAIREPANRLLFRPIDETPVITAALHERLSELFAPEMARLREFTGKPFSSWSV
jgi:hypothetical protein